MDDTIDILRGLKDRYEAHHRVKITDEAIVAAAELSDRYITGRFLPDKAIDLMDQAAARVRLRTKTKPQDTKALEDELRRVQREKDEAVANEDFEKAPELRDQVAALRSELEEAQQGRRPVAEVRAEDIAEVVSRATGIPVSQLTEEERERLMRLEEQLHDRVVGQEEAVEAVAEAIRRAGLGSLTPTAPSELPVPWAYRGRQDRASAHACRGALRRRGGDGAHRHERVPGAPHWSRAWSARLQAMLATRRQGSSPRPCGAGPTLCCF